MNIKGQKSKGRTARVNSVDGFVGNQSSDSKVSNPQSKSAQVGAVKSRRSRAPKIQSVESFPLPKYKAPSRPLTPIRKRHTLRRRVAGGVSVLITLVLLGGGFFVWKGYSKFHKVFHGTTTVAALTSKQVDPSLLKGEGDGRVNILLLGVGGAGHDGPDLTDTMVVLSVDPVNNTAAMLSIPRDLWVKMPVNYFGSSQKINAAYESGKYHYLNKVDASDANAAALQAGFTSVDQAVGQVLGITINYHVLVDFQAFRQAIDTVGGVTVDVKDQLYDPTMAWENGNNPLLAAAGIQQMNGVKALLYARSRETTSDFARTERQRQILLALKDKILTAGTLSNPAKIEGLLDAFGDNVYSDLSTQGASRLFTILRQVNDAKITSVGLAQAPNNFVTTDHVGNISVVRPTAGFNNYTAIQAYVRSQLLDGYLIKENAPIMLANTTIAASTAQTTLLKSYGYNVMSSTQLVSATQPMIVDLSGGKDPYTKHYLEDRYGVKAVTKLPSNSNLQPGIAKFVIINAK